MAKSFIFNKDTAVVSTTKGKIRGYFYNDLYIFKGVPYAKAARFHAPGEVDAWDGVKECTGYGFVCPLLSNDEPKGELMVPHRFWPMNENCQNLNVWTPGLDDKKRPVMVWLHGGGYEAGSSIEQAVYDGENMARLGDVVVVSINHRLNVLGYLDLSAFGPEYENSGNAGTDDIIESLKWIQKNIEAFGGDPANVCVFGQSGGGAKVTTLLQTPAADGLFHKGINMSGILDILMTNQTGDGKEVVEDIMKELGVSDVKALETIPYEQLAAAYLKIRPKYQAANKYCGGVPFTNKYYLGDPLIVGFREETKDIPLLVGSVFGEFGAFNPSPVDKSTASEEEMLSAVKGLLGENSDRLIELFQKAYPERPISDLPVLDFMFRKPEIEYVRERSKGNKSTWSYLFNQDSPIDGGRVPWHCSDIPYVFHNTELAPATWQEGVEELEDTIFSTVMAFARTGNPNNPLIPTWEADTPETESVMCFANDVVKKINHDHELVPELAKIMFPIFMKMMQGADVQH